MDNLPGYFTPGEVVDLNVELPTISLNQAVEQIRQGAYILDVRGSSEYAEGHIDGAINIPFGLLPQHLDALPQDRPIIVHCAGGVRAQVAASLLMKHSIANFAILEGGLDAWKAAGLALNSPAAAER
ncbi:MAG: rhodanese-like domain-containing protein [Anaerolineae bacterium]